MATIPPPAVAARYLDSIGRVTRRVVIYESDGKTIWNGYPSTESFLIDGNVSADYDRDERRTLDLTLDNTDRYFDSRPDGFWYDKVIKVYRGLQINQAAGTPKILVIADSNSEFMLIRSVLQPLGFTNLRVNLGVSTLADLAGYDIIVANDGVSTPAKYALINSAWDAGFSILTMGSKATHSHYPAVITTTTDVAGPVELTPLGAKAPAIGWTAWSSGDSGTNKAVVTFPAAANQFAGDNSGNATGVSLEVTGARWVHVCTSLIPGTQAQKMFRQVFTWLNPNVALDKWEVQCGEFMIDSIDEDNFPHQSVIKARDYTKKLMLSKFLVTTQFKAGLSTPNTVEGIIRTLAVNSGIDPNRITIQPYSSAGIPIPTDITYERDTTRWAAVKGLANDYNYEIFFDNVGTLVVRPFNDPTLGSPVFVFKTGNPDGSLVTYTKSANDSSLFNSIVVAGESSDSTVIPVYATAKNTDPKSPSNISRIGERVYTYTSPLLTTTAQCLALAKQYLAIYSLEEYSINFDSICLDWIEAGDIIDVVPDRIVASTPTRFLFTSFSIPLQLGPMSGSGKRMLIVG